MSPCHFQSPGHIAPWCVFLTPSKTHSAIPLEPKGRGLTDTHKDMLISKARSELAFCHLLTTVHVPFSQSWGPAALPHVCGKKGPEQGLLSQCRHPLSPPGSSWIQGYPGHQESRVNTEAQIEFTSHMN